MVQSIEGLEAELEVNSFGRVNLPVRSQIEIVDTGAPQDVPAHIAEDILRRRDKAGGIEPGLDRWVRDIAVANTIGPRRISRIGIVGGKYRGEGQAGLDLINAGQS